MQHQELQDSIQFKDVQENTTIRRYWAKFEFILSSTFTIVYELSCFLQFLLDYMADLSDLKICNIFKNVNSVSRFSTFDVA